MIIQLFCGLSIFSLIGIEFGIGGVEVEDQKYTLELVRELSKFKSLNLYLSISSQSELINEFKKLNLKCHFVDTYYDAKSAIIRSFKIKSIKKFLAIYRRK